MKSLLAFLASIACAHEPGEFIDGQEVIGHYEVVRTYTVVEHIDIVAEPEPDPYEGLLVFYDY